jgi:hypothetical protein
MKKVLLISPEAFGYYKHITKSLEDFDFTVDWLHQIPSENPFVKGFIRYFPSIGEIYSNSYFEKNINWDSDYQIVLVIKGEGLSTSMLAKLRSHFSNANFVFYNWDSFDNSKSALKKLSFFDIVKSFDNKDAETMQAVSLHPLFHCINEPPKHDTPVNSKYASFFAGTIHSARFSKISNIAEQISLLTNKESYLFFFFPSVLIFYIKKLSSKEFRLIPKAKVSFEKKSTEQLVNTMRCSDVVIDICNSYQNGLTMRTIEAVGLRKKLVTNNNNITQYPFYHPNNVLLISEMTDVKLQWFLDTKYHEFPSVIYDDLHISRWLQLLIEND